jgi:hypothetical protein
MLVQKLAASGAEAKFVEQVASEGLAALGVFNIMVCALLGHVDFTSPGAILECGRNGVINRNGTNGSSPVARGCTGSYNSTWIAQAHKVCSEQREFPIWLQGIAWVCVLQR